MNLSLENRIPSYSQSLTGPLNVQLSCNIDTIVSSSQQTALKVLRFLKPRVNRLGECTLHYTAGFLVGGILGYGICKLDKYLFQKVGCYGVYKPELPSHKFYYIMLDVQRTLNLALLVHVMWIPLGPTMTIATLSTGLLWGVYCAKEFNLLMAQD